uniref:CSON005643 protein n=1 Tax=Culicoides sonorensis TaxID=179676 RepID=A0A336LMU2_CULSO
MPKKNASTPTLTESRSKRTPKPNPKYAVDYVAKIRISPDRKIEEDEDYTSISKKRNDNDTSPEISQSTSNKLVKKKQIMNPTLTSEVKKLNIDKLSAKTPTAGRLSTLRNIGKRGSPVPVATPINENPLNSKAVSVKQTISTKTSMNLTNTNDNKTSKNTLEAKILGTGSSRKTSEKDEGSLMKKVSPISKTIRKMEKTVSDEIRIVNINDIMNQSKRKSNEEIHSNKKHKLENKEIEIIDIEDEISVSSAVVRPTRQTASYIELAETKQKPQVKVEDSPYKKNQNSLTSMQKKKLSTDTSQSPQNVSSRIIASKGKTPTLKNTVNLKSHESNEELGQVLAKRILRKVCKSSSDPENEIKHQTKTKALKITTFEKWSILNYPQIQPQPARSVLCLTLIKLGNKIKLIKLPSLNWCYRITLQKLNKENTDKGEIYTGDVEDCGILEGEKANYAPVNITFERCSSNNTTPNRSVVFQNKSFSIFMDSKPCKLVGAPQYIYDLIEIQTLLHIVDQVDPFHSYVDQGEK